MQKLATKIFVAASLAFGVFGILMVLSGGPDHGNELFMKLVAISVFIILPSFALSVATKYLDGRK